MKRRTYILGAGLSCGAGYPINNKLFKEVMDERLRALHLRKNADKKGYEVNYERVIKILGNKDFEKTYIEQYLQEYSKSNKGQPELNFLRILHWYLWDKHNNDIVPRYMQLFVRCILNPEDNIISFNYDLLLEKSFRDVNRDLGGLQDINYKIIYDPDSYEWPKILKPHGSVNWIVGLEPESIVNQYQYGPDLINVPAKQLLNMQYIEGDSIIWLTNNYFMFPTAKNIPFPLIKWYTEHQYETKDSLLRCCNNYFEKIKNACQEVVKNCDEIIIVGYRFSKDYDLWAYNNLIPIIKEKSFSIIDPVDCIEELKEGHLDIRFEDWINKQMET